MEILELKNNHMTKKETNYKCECPVCGTVFVFTEKEIKAPRKINFTKSDCTIVCPNENCHHVVSLANPNIIELDQKTVKNKLTNTTDTFKKEIVKLKNAFKRADVKYCHIYKPLTSEKDTTLIITMPNFDNKAALEQFLNKHHFKAVFEERLDRNTDMDADTLYSDHYGLNENCIIY